MPKRRKAAAAAVASQSPRQSPRASVKASAMPSPATTSRSSRSRSTSVSSKGEKTSPVPSPAPTSRGGRSRSRSAKEAEPVEETQTPRGRSNKRGAAAKASPSPKGSARLTRAVVQDEEKKGSASKDTKAGGRGRSRGRGKKTEEEEVPEEEEEVEEEAEVEEVESPKAKASAKKKPPAKKTPAKATSEKATPARPGRSRSRQTKPEPEPEEEEEAEDEEESKTQEEDSQTSSGSGRRSSRGRTTEVKTPPKKATPRNRRGQSKAEVSPETTEETMEEGEQEAEAEASPKGRSRRAAKSPAAKVTPPPQSRSRRSRGKQEPEKEEVPEKEEEPEKAEPEVEEIKEPEKVEEPEKEEPMKDEVPEKMEIPEKEEEPKVETAEDVDSAEKPDEKAEEMEQETEVPEEEAEQPELAEQATIEEETRQDKPDEAPVEDAEEPEDVEGSAPSGIETPPEEPAPPAEAPPVAVVSDDSVEEEVMEVETEPAVVKAAELRQPVAEAVMEAEVAAAPVTADGLEQLSPPAEEGESAAVENASQESAEATVPDAQAPAAEPHAAPYYPEVVTLSPDVPEQDVESVSPPPKSPEIISLNSPVAEESEISETVPSVTVDAATAAPEVISISPPPEPANSEPEVISVPDEVISVPDEVNNSAPTATTICEPITIEDEPVLSSRKRSHEEVEEADEEDLSSKKAKVVDLTEQEDAFDCQVTQVTLANGSQESPEKAKPATQEMEPDIVETVSEPMEVGQARGEGDYTAASSEVAVEAVNTVPESQNTCNSASSTEEDILKEYVVIEMSDVPGASTGEVQQAANRAQPSTDNHVSQTLPPSDKDPLFNRLFVSNHNVPSDSLVPQKQFAVVSYNILAECWMRRFADAYSYATPELFETRFRHTRIIEELRYLNADVVCLQEVDQKYFENTLLPEMTSLGYGGTFKSRMADEGFMEGEAIFYKNSRFTLLQTEGKYLKELADKEIESSPLTEDVRACVRKYLDLPDVVVVANLQCKVTGSIVAVGNVHVNYGNFEKPNAQCVQIACAIKELVSRANNGNTPHIICGDFNTPPDSPGYQLARDGYLSDDMIQKLQSSNNLEMPDGSKNSLVNHLWKGFQHTSSTLKSAYATVQEVEPSMTSLVGDVIKHCLDYIFYSSDSLDTVGVLQVASVADISANVGLPSQVFPSDHLSMKAVLSFK